MATRVGSLPACARHPTAPALEHGRVLSAMFRAARCRRRRTDLGGGGPRASRREAGPRYGEALASQATAAAHVEPSRRMAMALYAMSAVCVGPYRCKQPGGNHKNEHGEGRLHLHNPYRDMASHAMSVARVGSCCMAGRDKLTESQLTRMSPSQVKWQDTFRHEAAEAELPAATTTEQPAVVGSHAAELVKSTEVVGSCAAEIAVAYGARRRASDSGANTGRLLRRHPCRVRAPRASSALGTCKLAGRTVCATHQTNFLSSNEREQLAGPHRRQLPVQLLHPRWASGGAGACACVAAQPL